MQKLWERLDTLRAIVDTARASDIETTPEAIRIRYEPYAESYFVIEEVRRIEQRLIGELQAGRSVTGYLSADYGYGKTATAIYLWKQCLNKEIVAVPPFLFRQLKDLMQATKGWLTYQLKHTQPALIPELEQEYHKHVDLSVEELAKEIAQRQSISEQKAIAIVREYLSQQRDLTSTTSMLDFLRSVVQIAQQAGFKGVILFVDEIQEFLRVEEAGVKDAIQTISELVKGVRAMANLPLGVMFGMPVHPTETAIEEQAGDIMHRMRERGTALQLHDAYRREFPKDLWSHLCRSFGGGEVEQAIEEDTLDALGQLCERKDLSNGPRTVINAFKRVSYHYQQTRRPYTPLDLINDYLQGHIVFEGHEAKLTGTLRRLLESPVVQANPKYQQAIMLLAAYPRGVDKRKAGELFSFIEDLADKEQWLGEHITQLSEGYALIGLQERTEARPILEEIVRDFRRKWHFVYNERSKVDIAATAIFQELLPMLFPPRVQGQLANFSGHKKTEHNENGVAFRVLTGCFERLSSRFPERKICLALTTDHDKLTKFQPPEDIDLDFRLFVNLPDDAIAEITPTTIESANQDRRIDIHLNLKRTFGRQFPAELNFLHDIMAPERTSVQVILALSMRMWGWLDDHSETSEQDRQMIEAQRRTLHRYALQLLLPDANNTTLVEMKGIKASGAEQRLIESIFESKCAELYPNYKPLMVTRQWKTILRNYRDAMGKCSLAERRGRKPYGNNKDEIAKAFGWSHTAFESNARILHDMGVLNAHWGSGRGAESEAHVEFIEHPLETFLHKCLQQEGRDKTVSVGSYNKIVKSIGIDRLKEKARRQGYLPEEVEEALELLRLRQYIEIQPDGTVQEFAGALDVDELKHQLSKLEECLIQLAKHYPDELGKLEGLLRQAKENLSDAGDEVALDSAYRCIQDIRARFEQFIDDKARQEVNRLADLRKELERRNSELQPRELEAQISGSVGFERHIDDQRKSLQKQFHELAKDCEELSEKAQQKQREAQKVIDEQSLIMILEGHNLLVNSKQQMEEKLSKLQPYLTGLQHWREVVLKANVLRERLEKESPLWQQLHDEVAYAIMEDFASRRMEALLDWERFKAEVDVIEQEINAEENQRRNEFLQRKEQYENILGRLLPQRMIQATFDPKAPEQSYQVLYQGVLRKMQDWLEEQRESANRALNDSEYLIRERAIQAEEERNSAKKILDTINKAVTLLDQELVRNLEKFQEYSKHLEETQKQWQDLQSKLNSKRTEKEPPSTEEKPLLDALVTQRRSLEDLRRQATIQHLSLNDLFDRLKNLYRKGHIEVEISKRD